MTCHEDEVTGGHGRSWKVMEGHGRSWEVMGGHGRSWKVMEGHGRLTRMTVAMKQYSHKKRGTSIELGSSGADGTKVETDSRSNSPSKPQNGA